MEKNEVRIENTVTVAEVKLIPLTKVSLNYQYGKGHTAFFGIKQPVAIVAVSTSAQRAFRINGEEIPLDQLMQEVPSIREILASV